MKVDITDEALRIIQREDNEIAFKDGKLYVQKRTMYCKFCTFQSNDDWEQYTHFEETGHNKFLPLRFIHERVGEARLARPWDKDEPNDKFKLRALN